MPKHLFIVSIPHEKGIVQYDTQSMLMQLPAGYRVIDREPIMSILSTEILFTWKCEKIPDQDPLNYTAGIITGKARDTRM